MLYITRKVQVLDVVKIETFFEEDLKDEVMKLRKDGYTVLSKEVHYSHLDQLGRKCHKVMLEKITHII